MAARSDVRGSVESPEDFGVEPAGVAARWISEIELAEKDHTLWRKRAKKIIRRFKGDAPDADTESKRRFALLWSNMQTLGPATLARVPQAVVGRRWKDADQIGRTASEVLERSLNFLLDAGDFLDTAKGVRDDFLLLGRGVAFVRYVPHMVKVAGTEQAQAPDGQESDDAGTMDVVQWEETVFDHVSYEDFLHNPARKWAEVRWVCRIAYQTRDELIERFGDELGKKIPLDHGIDGRKERGTEGDEDNQWAKAAVYEIWDKASRKAIWISKGYTAGPLDERDDPLGLKDFFPCPRPALGTVAPDSLIPIPDYVYYESQVADIDDLTARIGKMMDALKVRGFYAAGGETKQDLQQLMDSDQGTMIPVDSWAVFAEKGGMKGLVEWFPIDTVILALKACVEARRELIADVYQITGIADIMRGDVDPDETATATKAKGNWGSLRVRDKQKELGRFVRDLLRISAEIIAVKFQTTTLSEMSNVQLLESPEQKQQIQAQFQMQAQQSQAQAQQAQAMQQPPPPPFQPPQQIMDMLGKPTWQELEGLLRNNTLRGFRVDVETDSTIEPDDQEEKQRRIEFVTAVGEYVAKSLPVIQVVPALMPVVTQGLLFLVRGFRVGREMEDVVEKAMDQLSQGQGMAPPQQPQGKPGDPPQLIAAKAQHLQASGQAALMKGQAAITDARTKAGEAQADVHLRAAQIHAEDQRTALDRQADVHMNNTDALAGIHQAIQRAEQKRLVHDINDTHPMRADTP